MATNRALLFGKVTLFIAVICAGITLIKNFQHESKREPSFRKVPYTIDGLLEEIRSRMFMPSSQPLHLGHPERTHFSQAYQSQYIDAVTGGLRGGFFVECGAAEGEGLSNTLFFERERNWTGLLVEASPTLFASLQNHNRKSYTFNTCLSLSSDPTTVVFESANVLGGIKGTMQKTHEARIKSEGFKTEFIPMKCYPLHRMLEAIGRTHVNYFSLDVEGTELDILKTIPFDHVTIDFITIEFAISSNVAASMKKLREIRAFFEGTGLYEQIAILQEGAPSRKSVIEGNSEIYGIDVVFKRKDVHLHKF